jgi:hypothetical protein
MSPKLTTEHGDPCPVRLCSTWLQGLPAAPRDREAGLLAHLQIVHYPDRTLDELRAALPELRATHLIRWGGEG